MKQKTFRAHIRIMRLAAFSASALIAFGAARAQTNAAPKPATNQPAAPAAQAADITQIPDVEITKTGDVVTGIYFKDRKALPEAVYQQIRKMETLKSLSFGCGTDEASLKILSGLPALESFSTNGLDVSDEGLALFATFKNLHTLTIYHPARKVIGTGFASLASMRNLESLTFAGTPTFGDPGMAALSQLSHLNSLRMWHCAVTIEGIKSLGALKELKSLVLGQCSTPKSPPMLKDDVVVVLSGFTSLESITLMEARLSLPALSKLQALPNLKHLTLNGVDIPAADIATLKQLLPKVQIDWTPATDTDKQWIEGTQGSHPVSKPVAAPAASTN